MWWPFIDSVARGRTRDLEEQILKLRRDLNALALDYESLYDKVKSALGRISKRAETVEKANAQEELVLPDVTEPSNGLLSPRQKTLQQQILRRRLGGAG